MQKEQMEKLLAEVYGQYIRHLAVYQYAKETYKEERETDTDALRTKLAETKASQMDLMERIKDKEISDDAKEAFTEDFNKGGIEVDRLDKQIENCDNKVADFEKAKQNIKETVDHYNRVKGWIEKKHYDKAPEYVQED